MDSKYGGESSGGGRGPISEPHGRGGAVHVEGATLAYRVKGTGRPVLVVGSAVYYPRSGVRRYRLLERSGHTPQLEEPAAFDRIVLEWLKQREGADS